MSTLTHFFNQFDDAIDYHFLTSVDGSVPRLQPIPSQHRKNVMTFYHKHIQPLDIEIDDVIELKEVAPIIAKLTDAQRKNADFCKAVIDMHHYYRYVYRPTITTDTTRLAQNDAIYIPGQMLMVPSQQAFSKVVPSNRPVNLSRSWDMLNDMNVVGQTASATIT